MVPGSSKLSTILEIKPLMLADCADNSGVPGISVTSFSLNSSLNFGKKFGYSLKNLRKFIIKTHALLSLSF